MPWGMNRLLARLLLAVACCLAALPAEAAAPPVIQLQDSAAPMDAHALARAWVDASGSATVEQVSRGEGPVAFEPAQPDARYRLGTDSVLWLHMRMQRGIRERQDWVLELPMPVLDHVTVYQRERGSWRSESAGDTIPVNQWAEPGRHPFFRVNVAAGEMGDVYVRIRHVTAANFPLLLRTAADHARHQQLEYLVLGMGSGALLLLIVGCLAKGYAYRDRVFGWYAGYAALTGLAVSAYTGVAAHLLWPGMGITNDAVMPVLVCLASGTAVLFVRNILGLRRRFERLDRLLLALAIGIFVVAPLPALLPKWITVALVSGCTVLAPLAASLAAVACWKRGDHVAKWVFAAYVPMLAAVLLGVLRVFGWIPVTAGSQYAVVAAMTIEVPLLLVALFIRSRDRHGAEVREQALTTHDALTGLLAPHLFQDRLRHVVARFRRDRESAAIIYIDLVNHGVIRDYFGAAIAEQSVLRSVIKLRRLLRDVDTVSRVGEARFGVILEGAGSRASVTERATRLIASGLTPLQGLKPDVTLQFHVAAVLLSETPMEAEEVEQALATKLSKMSPRTRRPIRFVEAEMSPPSDAGDSSLFPDVVPPRADEVPAEAT